MERPKYLDIQGSSVLGPFKFGWVVREESSGLF
jgi:hypothetical protein